MYSELPRSHVNGEETHTFWVRSVVKGSSIGSVIEALTLSSMGSQKYKTSTQMGDYICLRKYLVGGRNVSLVLDENLMVLSTYIDGYEVHRSHDYW